MDTAYIVLIVLLIFKHALGQDVSYNQPKLCPNASWAPNATTFPDNQTIGYSPVSIFVNRNNTVYATFWELNQILMWLEESTNPEEINSTVLIDPINLFVSVTGDIFIYNYDNDYNDSSADNDTNNDPSLDIFAINKNSANSDHAYYKKWPPGPPRQSGNKERCRKQPLLPMCFSNHGNGQTSGGNGNSGVNPPSGSGSSANENKTGGNNSSNQISNIDTHGLVYKLPLKANLTIIMSVNGSCAGLFVVNYTIYCSMSSHHQVVKKSLQSTTTTNLTIVAGNGSIGSTPALLHQPQGIFVNTDFLYVADSGNHRIQRFRLNESHGIIVAGNGTHQNMSLYLPTAVVLDSDKFLFIVDSGNHRIVTVELEGNGFRCIIGCSNSSGSASNELSDPWSLSFDSYGNIFVSDWGNHRIQKFSLKTNSCSETTTASLQPSSTTSRVTQSSSTTTQSSTTLNKTNGQNTSTTTTTTTTTFETNSSTLSSSTTSTGSNITTTNRNETLTSGTQKTETSSNRLTNIEITATTSLMNGTTSAATSINEITISITPSPTVFVPTCKGQTSTGVSCEDLESPCKMQKPCQNNGTCIDNQTSVTKYSCSCSPDFDGDRCQKDLRLCKPNPCWNDGTCVELNNKTSFKCNCSVGWTDDRCQTKINNCTNVKCLNNGVCRPLLMNYTCECLGNSYSGRHCEITALRVEVYKIVSKSFAYVGILALVIVAMFFVIMDILKYCFGVDPVHEERERVRRERRIKHRKPVVQRFTYVNA